LKDLINIFDCLLHIYVQRKSLLCARLSAVCTMKFFEAEYTSEFFWLGQKRIFENIQRKVFQHPRPLFLSLLRLEDLHGNSINCC